MHLGRVVSTHDRWYTDVETLLPTVYNLESIFGVKPDMIWADSDYRSVFEMQRLAQLAHAAVSSMPSQPCVAQCSSLRARDTRQWVIDEPIERNDYEDKRNKNQALNNKQEHGLNLLSKRRSPYWAVDWMPR